MKKHLLTFCVILFFVVANSYSQNENIKIGILGDQFSDFTLQTYQGELISTSDLRGKNILLISSRGKYNNDYWCGICFYQYAEFVDLELTQKIREQYNMEILFLLPYNKDTLLSWERNMPNGLAYIEKSRNPADPSKLTEGQKDWMQFVQIHFPKSFSYTNNKVPLVLPVLVDEIQQVSKGLDLMRMEWGGTKVLQNIPAVYIIDKEGILRYKYISQSTEDRPSAASLLKIIETL